MKITLPITLAMLTAIGLLASACTTTAPAPAAKSAVAVAPQLEERPVTAAAAANMAANCFGCHGPNGVSPGSIPSLHSFTSGYISAKLKAFKKDELPSTVMGRHAKGYSNHEIDAIAIHIATLNGNNRNN